MNSRKRLRRTKSKAKEDRKIKFNIYVIQNKACPVSNFRTGFVSCYVVFFWFWGCVNQGRMNMPISILQRYSDSSLLTGI